MIEKIVVGAILHNAQGDVLLQLRDDKPGLPYANHWTLFGGSAEAGETPDEAIRRELLEELELALPLTFWKFYRCPIRSIDGVITTNNHIFIGQMTRELSELTLHEGQAMRYFSRHEVADMRLAFDQHLILNEWINTHD